MIKDPHQNINRKVHDFNFALDKNVVRPIAEFYSDTVPGFVIKGISNFFTNLSEPGYAINNLLQLQINDSLTNIQRFAFNTTLGLGGLIDIMSAAGVAKEPEDFGQTLAYWGVKPGSYIVLPFFGPSSFRDTVGRIGDLLLYSPTRDIDEDIDLITFYTLNVTDTRTKLLSLDKILDQQVDPYSFMRSSYEQVRINAVYDGQPPEQEEDF